MIPDFTFHIAVNLLYVKFRGKFQRETGNEDQTFSSGSVICIRFEGYDLSPEKLETPLKLISKIRIFLFMW